MPFYFIFSIIKPRKGVEEGERERERRGGLVTGKQLRREVEQV